MTHILNCQKENHVMSGDVRIFFTLDLSGNLKSIDPAGEQILGYRRQELRRTNLRHLVAPEFAEYVRQQIARAGIGELGAVYEIEVIAKDGRKVRLEISTRLVMRNDCPFELEGIALLRGHVHVGRPRCLDEQFTVISGPRPYPTLTFSSPGNKP
jgi:PAS domain S-box-containing protein